MSRDEMEIGYIIPIKDAEFWHISKLVYKNFGINLTEKKKSLVTGRLQRVIKSLNMTSFKEYIDYIDNNPELSEKILTELVNRISTNHTFFFREYEHFKFFTEIALPEIEKYHKKKSSKDIKFWCAASSSGEEPYTIAIHLLEYFGANYSNWNAGLLATDISEEALSKAIKGIYREKSIDQIPIGIRNNYFTKDGENYKVIDKVKNEVMYRKFNLMTPQFPFKGNFDIIFCRNVMIYFDKETKEVLINKLYKLLRPGGYLFIGHAETLNGLKSPFNYVKSAIYQKSWS